MATNEEVKTKKYTAKDFASDQDVRWCPGCGDYSILAQVQRSFPEIIEKDVEKNCMDFRYWLFKQVSLLYEHLRFSWNSW